MSPALTRRQTIPGFSLGLQYSNHPTFLKDINDIYFTKTVKIKSRPLGLKTKKLSMSELLYRALSRRTHTSKNFGTLEMVLKES